MIELNRIHSVLGAIKQASLEGMRVYAHSRTALALRTMQPELLTPDIQLIVTGKWDQAAFYARLLPLLTINEELKSGADRYYVRSGDLRLLFDVDGAFDPSTSVMGDFNYHRVFYDLTSEQFVGDSSALQQITSTSMTLKSVLNPTQWNTDFIFRYFLEAGDGPDNCIVDASDKGLLAASSLKETEQKYDDPIGFAYNLLKTRRPGRALKLICDLYADGREWLFYLFVDLLIEQNVFMGESATVESAFTDKKLSLIDVYSTFLLTKGSETPEQANHRVVTALRLLFDSPLIDISLPVIRKAHVVQGAPMVGLMGLMGPVHKTELVSLFSTYDLILDEPEGIPIYVASGPGTTDYEFRAHVITAAQGHIEWSNAANATTGTITASDCGLSGYTCYWSSTGGGPITLQADAINVITIRHVPDDPSYDTVEWEIKIVHGSAKYIAVIYPWRKTSPTDSYTICEVPSIHLYGESRNIADGQIIVFTNPKASATVQATVSSGSFNAFVPIACGDNNITLELQSDSSVTDYCTATERSVICGNPCEGPSGPSGPTSPYQYPPECKPSVCYEHGGSKCCCCDATNYTTPLQVRCHERVVVSCNEYGDGPLGGHPWQDARPGPVTGTGFPHCKCDPFPEHCDACHELCHDVLTGTACGNNYLAEWFGWPAAGPCTCNCKTEENGVCKLTCATCRGELCQSTMTIEGANCGFKMWLTPSEECCGSGEVGADFERVVPATACVAFAGQDSSNATVVVSHGNSDIVGQHIPVELDLPHGATKIRVLASGSAAHYTNGPRFGPDGDPHYTSTTAEEYALYNISGLTAKYCSLCGVFLTDDLPQAPTPAGLNGFTANPALQQTFYIGASSEINVPEGATRLFLGFHDIWNWTDNDGGFDVVVTAIFPLTTSCDCLDFTPIPIYRCLEQDAQGNCIRKTDTTQIGICVRDDLSDCDCTQPIVYEVCGHTVVVQPTNPTMRCCNELGWGCECPVPPPEACCGPRCPGVDICPPNFNSKEDAIARLWGDCCQEFGGHGGCYDPGSCPQVGDCPDPCHPDLGDSRCADCYILLPDGQGGFREYHYSQLVQEVGEAWQECFGPTGPPPPWDVNACKPSCRQKDECIDNATSGFGVPCDGEHLFDGCSFVEHPAVVSLNDGIGLVAYEVAGQEGITSIKIRQFKTSMPSKVLPNREFNLGRLQHKDNWFLDNTVNGYKAKLYYYGDEAPEKWITGGSPTEIKAILAFRNGPLLHNCCPILSPALGEDETGKFISFFVSTATHDAAVFPGSDDVYNIKWFVLDGNDQGYIGSASDGGSAPIGRDRVDAELQLPPHLYGGKPVPAAFPSLTTCRNYSNLEENSQFVYLTYQALEDDQWNVYLRQLRISEFLPIAGAGASKLNLTEAGIDSVVYRVVCVDDDCRDIPTGKVVSRTVTFQVLTPDGREVYNDGYSASERWGSLCSGASAMPFTKDKVFATLTHSVVASGCPDYIAGYDAIFTNWRAGDEFTVVPSAMSPLTLFQSVQKGDFYIDLGEFTTPVVTHGISIYSSHVQAFWYDSADVSTWSVIVDPSLQQATRIKGLSASEPVLLSSSLSGHSTRPVVKADYNNDVFVAFQTTDGEGLPQIQLVGTKQPQASLPVGVYTAKNLDDDFDFFLKSADFVYSKRVTATGINSLPTMFVDLNGDVHLAWQSKRTGQWAIYYASSEDGFVEVPITEYDSNAVQPSITGDEEGRIFVAWADDRFGTWEIMLAYKTRERIAALVEQDPYWAGARNGFSHGVNEIPITMVNGSSNTICVTDLMATFYEDRLKQREAFVMTQSEFPMSFEVEGGTTQSTTEEWTTFAGWSANGRDLTSDVVDTSLETSELEHFNLDFSPTSGSLNIAFRAADSVFTDPNEGWTAWYEIPVEQSGNNVTPKMLGITEVIRGRYKQVRLEWPVSIDLSWLHDLTIASILPDRVCIPPNSNATGTLNLKPKVRVDAEGNVTVDGTLPLDLVENQAYFVALSGLNEAGQLVDLGLQNYTVSVSTIYDISGAKALSGESLVPRAACAVPIRVENESSVAKYYNFKVSFYADAEREVLLQQYNTFPMGHLRFFTVEGDQPADDVWTSRGLRVSGGGNETVILWPVLNAEMGLLCDIEYYLKVEYCAVEETIPGSCDEQDLMLLTEGRWTCLCDAVRAKSSMNSSLTYLERVARWHSSAHGVADTRITESISAKNISPKIACRSNHDGVILYSSDRSLPGGPLYEIYASIFSYFPGPGMYASAARNIVTPVESLFVKSDIPICPDEGCVDEQGHFQGGNVLQGTNPAMDLDYFDHLFIAAEQRRLTAPEAKCDFLLRDNSQIVRVHRCGADPEYLAWGFGGEGGGTTEPSATCGLLDQFVQMSDAIKPLVLKARIANNDVEYHVSRQGAPMAVVSHPHVVIEVVGAPGVVAIRLRNSGHDEWSEWFPFEPETDDYMTRIRWTISRGNGYKNLLLEAAGVNGLTQTFSVPYISDYRTVEYTLSLYIASGDNYTLLKNFDGFPVASLAPEIADNNVTYPQSKVLKVEIVPSIEYMTGFSADEKTNGTANPTFDFFQQGDAVSTNNVAQYSPTRLSGEPGECFVGDIVINRETGSAFRDGLAAIVPHFVRDYSKAETAVGTGTSTGNRGPATERFTRDKWNIFGAPLVGIASCGEPIVEEAPPPEEDVSAWYDDSGFIKYRVRIRPGEDPHLIFGDPDYRFGTNDN